MLGAGLNPNADPRPVVVLVFDELGYQALLRDDGAIDSIRYPNLAGHLTPQGFGETRPIAPNEIGVLLAHPRGPVDPLASVKRGVFAPADTWVSTEYLFRRDEDGDHDRFSHYVKKEKILQSALSGKPVRALCGKKWTPGRDPEKFPVCPECKEIWESMKPGGGEGGDGSGSDA